MAKTRAFSSDGIPSKKDDYHGSCQFVRTSPDIASKQIKSVNVELTFEEALKLSLGLQAALFALNRYKRNTTKGRKMGVCLSLKTDVNSISVIEAPVKSKTS